MLGELYTGVPVPALPFVRCMILGKSLTFSKLLPMWKKGLVKYFPYRVAVKYQKANTLAQVVHGA